METTIHLSHDADGRLPRYDHNLVQAVGILAAGLAKLASAVELPAMDARLRIKAAQDVRAAAEQVKGLMRMTDSGPKPSREALASIVEQDEP